MATEEQLEDIRRTLKASLAAERAVEELVAPLVGDDPLVLTKDRLARVDEAFTLATEAEAEYRAAKKRADWA
jgi:hypothetical protein